ncbi:DUF5680 domain-containing protein [Ferdinandcohnia quinoae]|uniref:DUF5680 domain-containing protein n=1 Tax=Fredinandcohnia quinoae TaxID=2918902 RepID=A0AAW5E2M5_9BACI|nr:DUF5680 domain-containing protein [Fredinandcohnia sp. SECRCQ15]MCH1627136.1 DUF5680 domain-containing protein [Fredinandcohnia sp. SECRCQ15]
MNLSSKIQVLRKKNGFSQEELAEKLGVSRQAVGKWECNQTLPDIDNLIRLSAIFNITIDRLVKDDDQCNKLIEEKGRHDIDILIDFLIKAKKETYAGGKGEVDSSRPHSNDLQFEEGAYLYYDTYLGGECFVGEEAVWVNNKPIWALNYSGRVIGDNFSGDFLKEALSMVPKEMPYRGPGFFQKGLYSYHCKVDGEFSWFQGFEEIYYNDLKIYECYIHGGKIK